MNLKVSSKRSGSLTYIAILFLLLVIGILNYQLKMVNEQVYCNNQRIIQMKRTIR